MRKQLLARQDRLHTARSSAPGELVELLNEVDAALERMEAGTYEVCEGCHEPIEHDRLLADPLCRNCLDHLSPTEQRALERDLDLAFQIQHGLLPKPGIAAADWTMAYHYQPVGPVSGDYCDLIALEDGTSLFLLGDVMGKGVAASILMAHLHAIFRSLTAATRQVHELVAKANRVFCEGTLSSFFATLVCGSLGRDRNVRLQRATALPARVRWSTCPIGPRACRLGCSRGGVPATDGSPRRLARRLRWAHGTFGAREQFGVNRLGELLERRRLCRGLLAAALEDLEVSSDEPRTDDLSVMVPREARADRRLELISLREPG